MQAWLVFHALIVQGDLSIMPLDPQGGSLSVAWAFDRGNHTFDYERGDSLAAESFSDFTCEKDEGFTITGSVGRLVVTEPTYGPVFAVSAVLACSFALQETFHGSVRSKAARVDDGDFGPVGEGQS